LPVETSSSIGELRAAARTNELGGGPAEALERSVAVLSCCSTRADGECGHGLDVMACDLPVEVV
jgi:hypothetical protein